MMTQITIPCLGYSPAADWHEGDSSHGILLVFVGFGSSKKSNHDFVARIVTETGLSALVVDSSGHGESSFEIKMTTPAQHIQESVAAYDWIAENHPSAAVYAMGTSYGGFIVAFLSKFRAVEKLVLRTPAIYEPSTLFTQHQFIDKLHVREYRQDTSRIEKHPLFAQDGLTESKTLIIVHENDESVPRETTDIYSDAFDAQVYIAKGFSHFV